MKIIHTKNAKKSEEELIIESISKQMKGAFKNLGKISPEDLIRVNNITKDILKKFIDEPIIKCLTCGSNCPEGDCQLGME